MTRGAGFGAGLRPGRRRRSAAGFPSKEFALSATLPGEVTFTRASSATQFNAAGALVSVAVDAPRFDYHPVTLARRGLLIEEARTNLLLNSLLNGTNLSTQGVAVSAQIYVISFYGTGTITLSGAHVATVNGAGAFPARTTLAFTPSAGTLTCTVTGTVQYAQLEAGNGVQATATSFIPTAGAAVTRAVDDPRMTGANFSNWFNAAAGTFVAHWESTEVYDNTNGVFSANDATVNERIDLRTAVAAAITDGGVGQAFLTAVAAANVLNKTALAYAVNDFSLSLNGAATVTDTLGTLPTVTQLQLGHLDGTTTFVLNGWLQRLNYFNARQPDATLRSLSA